VPTISLTVVVVPTEDTLKFELGELKTTVFKPETPLIT
jgi:hypothetical protein